MTRFVQICEDVSSAFSWPMLIRSYLHAQGNRTTPSYVAFTDTERLIGDAAKNQTAMNPINTGKDAWHVQRASGHDGSSNLAPHAVFDAKRLIGRKFADPIVQSDCKLWPFKVRSGAHDIPEIVGENSPVALV